MKVNFWNGYENKWEKTAEGDMRQLLFRLIGQKASEEITSDPKWQEDQYHYYPVAGILMRVKGDASSERKNYDLKDFYKETGYE